MIPPGPGIGPTSGVIAISRKPAATRPWRTSGMSVQPRELGLGPIFVMWGSMLILQIHAFARLRRATYPNRVRNSPDRMEMVAHVATVAFLGLEARSVEVRVQIAAGLPKFLVVGLPDKGGAGGRGGRAGSGCMPRWRRSACRCRRSGSR